LPLAASTPAPLPALTFARAVVCDVPHQPCTPAVVLHGTLPNAGVSDALIAYLAQQPDHPRLVSFDSDGGNVRQAVLLGRLIRRWNLATYVGTGQRCRSACIYAFLGGMERTVRPNALFGIHAHTAPPGSLDATVAVTEGIIRELALHLEAMGADPALLNAILTVPADRMCYVRFVCLRLSHVDTTAPWPYLANRAACSVGGSAWREPADNHALTPTLCRAVDPWTNAPLDEGRDPIIL